MAIKKPAELDYSSKNLILILSGTPGVGKTTLALSAPDVLLIDTDNGLCRVRAEHRRDASICRTFQEIRDDIAEAKKSGQYRTIVLDTGGSLVEMIKQFVIDHPEQYPKGGKASGGLSIQGFGFVKQLFLDFSAELRRFFNVVYLFHETKQRDDDSSTYEIVCEGSARTLVYQPADLAAHMFIQGNQRMLGFTPTEQYFAKGAYGIRGLIQVPELGEHDPNDFLTKLFSQIRENLKKETEELAPKQTQYDKVMQLAQPIIASVNTAEDVPGALKAIGELEHALTSEKEIKALLKARMKQIGVKYDAGTKTYVAV